MFESSTSVSSPASLASVEVASSVAKVVVLDSVLDEPDALPGLESAALAESVELSSAELLVAGSARSGSPAAWGPLLRASGKLGAIVIGSNGLLATERVSLSLGTEMASRRRPLLPLLGAGRASAASNHRRPSTTANTKRALWGAEIGHEFWSCRLGIETRFIHEEIS